MVVGDLRGALAKLQSLPESSGKVGTMGFCMGGRFAYLAGCKVPGLSAAIDCWGGGVVMGEADLTDKRPVAPIDYTKDLNCPVLGLFGNEDRSPTAEQVDQHEAALKEHGKEYEFHRYDDAGHGFFYHHVPMYRQAQAVDGWNKIWAFLEKHIG